MRIASVSTIAAATFAIGCAETEEAQPPAGEGLAAGEYPGAVAADPARYAVEFENDAVRLLRITYGPGERSVMHRHPPTCSIALGDASWRMTDAEGEVTDDTTALGEVECGDEESIHLPENPGSVENELILVEFKDGATAGTDVEPELPAATEVDAEHYSVEFENDVARIVRVSYGPGETSVMHSHPAHCVVFLGSQPVTFELPSGEVMEPEALDAGSVVCMDAEAHRPTNVGDAPLEVVLVELKGRATL